VRHAPRILWILLLSATAVGCSSAPARPARASSSAPIPAPAQHYASTTPPGIALASSTLTPDQQILHVLNRVGYGPRPGDVERVRQMGLAAYLRRQLDPASIPDPEVDQALRRYPTLTMSTAALAAEYPRPAKEARRKVASGEMGKKDLEASFPPERRPFRVVAELQAAKLTRAVFSERQLEEVMVDFWFNHFNVNPHKGAIVHMATSYERDAIRPHALGRFRDLLTATARHPAMLYYLDNWLSTRADYVLPSGPNQGRRLGLNENYARELMELHTLGVDGGYTQQDIVEVARCFTGWSIDGAQQTGGFVFRSRAHDQEPKRVLGRAIPSGGGERDGLMVIDLLARHPSTARFISTKLARRFVSDDPPPALVARAAAVFRETDGDIRAVLAAIFSSPEFLSPEAYRAKIKTPLEVTASAVRAVAARIEPPENEAGEFPDGGAFGFARRVARLGQPLYEAQPPTGYADRAEAWVNTGALITRMNFALDLAQNRLTGIPVDVGRLIAGADRGQPGQVLDRLVETILHGEVTPETRRVLAAQIDSAEITRVTSDDRTAKNIDVERLAALVLGSPEFQRR
jgi:uncharacterized protein (DUF1800 family)